MVGLRYLLEGVVAIDSQDDIDIADITLNSRDVVPGALFVALSGSRGHGLDHAADAIDRGARAIVAEKVGQAFPDASVPVFYVADLRAQLGGIAARFFDIEREVKVIGITGTDGKTTSASIIAQILGQIGSPCGMLGTLGYGFPAALKPLGNTTPDVISVHRFIAKMASEGARYIAMEVSSHGLVQQRENGVSFAAAVLTNLGSDHLDYHGTLESYAAAKRKLFGRPGAVNVLNVDDDFGVALSAELVDETVLTYGCDATAEVTASNIKLMPTKTTFDLCVNGEIYSCETRLVGQFNVYNVLAAIATLYGLGFAVSEIVPCVRQVEPVAGRMERIAVEGKPVAIIDFAHTPQALENALRAVLEIANARVTVVFGCGGDRDKSKRPAMARIAERYADTVVVTDDNPRFENPENILSDILAGFSSHANVKAIHNRRIAIELAMAEATVNDIVLIAGKGHEAYQDEKGTRTPFSDQAVVRKWMEAA